ncbi:MAG: peptidase M64 [Chlorobi bacterium]|nr:peptidase M64 [Chlorobiota bacterium]
MNRLTYIVILSFSLSFSLKAQVNFSNYFEMQALRIDFIHCGNFETEAAYFEQIKQEPFWAGSKVNLIDPFNYGDYRIMVYDSTSNQLIYSCGFGSLFREWQTTEEAKKMERSFYETVICPFPKNTINVHIESRNKKNKFSEIFSLTVNPDNYFIKKEKNGNYRTIKLLSSGIPSKCIDLVIIPDGYTEKEMIKFRVDAKRFTEYLFRCSPYDKYKNKFNVRAVEAISNESGTDIPKDSIWKNTILNTSFYTFNSERYLMTYDINSVRDIAASVPYDQILILVNSDKYGGGGIYNFYSVCSSDNKDSEFVFTHEFGHGFASLADEYFTSDVAYNDYFDLNIEPYEPNITTLVDFESKWKNMVDEKTPVPTPEKKKYLGKIGAFEGGGYVAKGVYRPTIDCSMKSRLVNRFCPVCQKAIEDMILQRTK